MNRIYMDDCICQECANCNIEDDICNIGRMRYPTDGCFDFVSVDDPTGENALSKTLKAIMKE